MSQEMNTAAAAAGGSGLFAAETGQTPGSENFTFPEASETLGAPGAPAGESYDNLLPEGFPAEHVDQNLLGRFKQFCAGSGLSSEQAARAVNFYLTEQNGLAEQMQERCEADLRARWGSRYDERLSEARRTCFALDKRMGGRLMPLVGAGLGNHPAFGELMALVGRSMAEDSFGSAPGAAAPQAPLSTEEYLRQVVFKKR